MLDNRLVFNLGATLYDLFTSQQTWWNHCRNLTPPDADPESILDVGCGPGISAFALEEKHPEAEIVGLDLAEKMIRRAQKTKRERGSSVNFLIGNAEGLPFPDNSFDWVTGHSFLYLLENRRDVLDDVHRVLDPGGSVTFLEPRKSPGFEWVNPSLGKGFRFFTTMIGWQIFSGLHGRFEEADLQNLLTEAGFESVDCQRTLNGLGWIGQAQSGASS
jgi:ubiquinone/menaquinone biosynthesis C-methylase UbiE